MPQQPDVPLDGLYGDLVMRHYRSPHNVAPLGEADVEAEEFNPFCGDRAIFQLKLDGQGIVSGVSARAEGCSIIQAATSMLSDLLHGKSLGDVEEIGKKFRDSMYRDTEEDSAELGDLLGLVGPLQGDRLVVSSSLLVLIGQLPLPGFQVLYSTGQRSIRTSGSTTLCRC